MKTANEIYREFKDIHEKSHNAYLAKNHELFHQLTKALVAKSQELRAARKLENKRSKKN